MNIDKILDSIMIAAKWQYFINHVEQRNITCGLW